MPLFSAPNPMELEIERITSENNTSEDWSLILDLCDQVATSPAAAKDCFKILVKRLNHQNPHVVLHSLTLLDACVNNSGKRFHLEICSREFENEVRRLLTKGLHVKVGEKVLQLVKKWADMKEFKDDPQLSLIPSLYRQLKKEGYNFSIGDSINKIQKLPTDPNVVSSNEEEEDIAKAIAESLRVTSGHGTDTNTLNYVPKSTNSSVYPSFDSEITNGKRDLYQVRALYDFEAAEDNELTFKTGEVIVVLDDSDANWWKGSNHRGEGLFPANFVTTELTEEAPKVVKTVQFNEEVRVKVLEKEPDPLPVTVDADKIDRLISLLHEADPTGEKPDSEELLTLEEQVLLMAPLIDEELQKSDRVIASLNALNSQLVEALNMYHSMMREESIPTAGLPYYAPVHQMPSQWPAGPPPQQQQPPPGPPQYMPPQQQQQQALPPAGHPYPTYQQPQ